MTDEERKLNESHPPLVTGVWRTVWAVVFVVMSIQAILVAAIINSRREINVTKPILRMSGSAEQTEFDFVKIDSYLSEAIVIENTTLYCFKDSQPFKNPQAYFDALRADFKFLAKLMKFEKAEFPQKIYIFDRELDEYIIKNGYGDGWISNSSVYVPAQRSAAKQLLFYILDKKNVDYDSELIDGVADFITSFLDFYADHPYESQFEKTRSTWQKNTPITLPLARVILNDERLGADFVSIPVRQSLIFTAATPQAGVLRTGFYRYLLDKYGWDGFSKLLIAGGKGDVPFEVAYGKPAADLLKDYQEALDLLSKDSFTYSIAKLEAMDQGLLKHAIPDQIIADAESVFKSEVKRFKLPQRDLAQRNDALGRIILRKYFLSSDIESPQVKKLASDVQGILLSSNANVDALSEIEHRWLVASIFERVGDHEAADRLYEVGLSDTSLRNFFLPRFVKILLARRNFQRASDVLESYLQNYPNDLDMLYTRMACLSRIGNNTEAGNLAPIVLKHPLIELGLRPEYKLLAEYVLDGTVYEVNDSTQSQTETDS